jgi:shikimate dehydrogenase
VKVLRFAVIGDPVNQSKSPKMHAAAFAALGLPYEYTAIRVGAADLRDVVARVRDGTLDGINITKPHKRRVLEWVDGIDPSASVVGAANTLTRDPAGRVVAFNTDVPALAEELRHLAPEHGADAWKRARTLVLGTGATARSAIVALAFELQVAEIVVRGRSFGSADTRGRFSAEMDELLSSAGVATPLRLEPWRASPEMEEGVCGIVQATSVGMVGADPGEAAVEAVAWTALPPTAVALDVVYAPPQTPFLDCASSHHLRVANGLGMLARQGALSLERWLGVPAPYEVMVRALA